MSSLPRDAVWYLAQVKPNCHQIAERNLARQGFDLFTPLEEQTRRRNGGFVTQRTPLFPGYIFLRPDPAASAPLRAVQSTQGISRLVAFGASPAPVPTAVIDALMQGCDSHGCLIAPADLKTGDHVRVTSGPFTDLLAEIIALSPDRRIWLLLDFMGNPTRLAIHADQLRPA